MDRRTAVAALAGGALSGCGTAGGGGLRAGSKNFTEQLILGEIIAQHVESRLGVAVKRQLNLGGTLLAHQAMLHGELDFYPEYTGTAYSAILNQSGETVPASVLARVREAYAKLGMRWLDPLGFNNSFAVVMRGEDARKYSLTKLSDAGNKGVAWRLGAGYEFEKRADGMKALTSTYPSLKFDGTPSSMDLGLLYMALHQKKVDLAVGSSTDGVLTARDFVALEDDQHAFGPYQACVVVREESLRSQPKLEAVLSALSSKIDTRTMSGLNYQMDGEHRKPAEVAAGFLKSVAG